MRHPAGSLQSIWKAVYPARPVSLALLLITFLVFSSARVFADEGPSAVRLSYVQGSVQIMMGNQTQFQ